jgi:hypothetical protein
LLSAGSLLLVMLSQKAIPQAIIKRNKMKEYFMNIK